MRVVTRVATPYWSMTADTDAPQGALSPARALLAPLQAAWQVDVLPPQVQPSSVVLRIYDDGTNPSGWIPLDVGTPIAVYQNTDNGDGGVDGPITFQGRIGEVSGVNASRGGIVFTAVLVCRLADLTASPAPSKLVGNPAGTGSSPVLHPLFRAYNRIASHAGIELDYTGGGGEPFWENSNTAELSMSTLDALNLYTAHDVRDGVFQYLSYPIDSGTLTPPADQDYELVAWDPEGVDGLAGILELVYGGGVWGLQVNADYYLDHDGMVLHADQLLRDVGDWRKGRQAQIDTVELTGSFVNPSSYPTQVGLFEGNSGAVASATPQPNVTAIPADVQDGDWAWCVITANAGESADPIQPPAGWVQHPTGPLQVASTVRSWLFTAQLSEDDAGTVPVWTIVGTAGWVLVGAVVTSTDGMDPTTPAMPGTSVLPVPSSASTAVNFPDVLPGGKNRLAYAVAGLRQGTGSALQLLTVNFWTIESSSQNSVVSSRMAEFVVSRPLGPPNRPGGAIGLMSASGVSNGVAWSFTFGPAGATDSVRAQFADLVAANSRNARQLDSFLYYRDDAEDLAELLLGDRSQVQTGYGLTSATIVWETLSDEQRAAWSRLLWPSADSDALGKPIAVVDIPDDWRLVDGPAVFGRLVGLTVESEGETVRVGLTVRGVPALTSAGITWADLPALSPDVTCANLDPSITIEQFSLVEG